MSRAAKLQRPGMHWPALMAGVVIMLVVSVDPRFLISANPGRTHLAAALLCWAMSAALVRGVGFVPVHALARRLLSGWASAMALAACLAVRFA
ncbi:cyd operon YbgE family protein [Cupriavidus pinatubonensis]|uniref:cyd operon YbgE family protein n=1 Tax=Cupriavidus pinatubonensis TaxID=248026 RepID=UPI002159E9CE|nr:cyd operon YbgE family protein [Cupriavidus pinatubonensis]